MRKMGSWGSSETEDLDIDLIMLLVSAGAHSLAISRFRCARARLKTDLRETARTERREQRQFLPISECSQSGADWTVVGAAKDPSCR